MAIDHKPGFFRIVLGPLLFGLSLGACAQVHVASWYDGKQLQDAWVDAGSGKVALSASAQGQYLHDGLTVVTAPGQAEAVRASLQKLGLEASRRLVPDRVYVRVASADVLATTLLMRGLPDVVEVRLQWAARIAVPTRPQ